MLYVLSGSGRAPRRRPPLRWHGLGPPRWPVLPHDPAPADAGRTVEPGPSAARRDPLMSARSPADSTKRASTETVRLALELWERIGKAAAGRGMPADRRVVEHAMETLDGDERQRACARITVVGAALVASQAPARQLTDSGRGNQIERIGQFISIILPEPNGGPCQRPRKTTRTRLLPIRDIGGRPNPVVAQQPASDMLQSLRREARCARRWRVAFRVISPLVGIHHDANHDADVSAVTDGTG